MSGSFLTEDFLLETDLARFLFHDVAKALPIVDYHCHLPVDQIRADHRFRSITEIWLDGDHYKWRAMRANGVAERFCTGDASDFEKFEAWAKTVPKTIRNPLYHWTHMELKRPFGIEASLDGSNARAVYDDATSRLQEDGFTTLGLLRQFGVAAVCTTDDPTDSLEHHAALAGRRDPDTAVYPTWRPDRALGTDDPPSWNAWVDALEKASGLAIGDFTSFMRALEERHAAFHALGCRASDHGLERMYSVSFTEADLASAFARLRSGRALDAADTEVFRSGLLHLFAVMDHGRGWVQQFHLGALRNTNARGRRTLGPDKGFDSIGDFEQAAPLARFLDRLDDKNQLARTILYNLNPRDNELFASMTGNFQDGSVAGKMQYGAAWWFLDQKDGMEAQLRALSSLGLFSRFIGMVTDSRSFLSYSRHEYYRRLVCNLLGNDVRAGLLPDDRGLLADVIRAVCFTNARDYLGLDLGRLGAGPAAPTERDAMLSMFSLEGRVALVTGGSRGIGAGIAQALAEAGADVAVHGNETPAQATAEAVGSRGRRACIVVGDMADPAVPDRLVRATVDSLGRLDIVVNNAGIIRRGPTTETTDEDFDAVIEVNLNGVFRLCRAAGRHMLSSGEGGRIINIASLLSFQGGLNVPAYAAAKSAIAGLTRELSNEWAGRGINVNAIAPGYIRTDNTRALQNDETRHRQILERIPAGRWGEAGDLGGAAVFLASPASRYVHGHILAVDGGWLAR